MCTKEFQSACNGKVKDRHDRYAFQSFCFILKGGVQVPGWGEGLPSNRLMGMCLWMGSHFYDWVDYNGVVFLIVTRMGHVFSGFGG